MKTNLQNYWYFPQKQRNGIIALVFLIMVLFVAKRLLPLFLSKQSTDFSALEQEIEVFENNLVHSDAKSSTKIEHLAHNYFPFNPNTVTKAELLQLGLSNSVASTFLKFRNAGTVFRKKEDLLKVYGLKEADYKKLAPYINIPKQEKRTSNKAIQKAKAKKLVLTPFPFNPNSVSKEALLKLGLSPNVAQTFINYRSKGGHFWKKEDVAKVYGLTDEMYQQLLPYIEISLRLEKESISKKAIIPNEYAKSDFPKIDVNQSDIEDWKKLKGIGEITAKRIINFREKLGGFVSIEQIKSTYYVPDSVIENNKHYLVLSPIPNKINLNTVSIEKLRQHPYIDGRKAAVIINYRTNHGSFKDLKDLEKIRGVNTDLLNRISPYLSFN